MATALEQSEYGRIPSLLMCHQSLTFILQNSGNINDLATLLPTAENIAGDTLPQVTVGGTVTMTYRQLNDDGAGPITCRVSADATECFAAMEVTTNVPGDNGRSNVQDTNFVSLLNP
jgi:Egh16-like virulence factor